MIYETESGFNWSAFLVGKWGEDEGIYKKWTIPGTPVSSPLSQRNHFQPPKNSNPTKYRRTFKETKRKLNFTHETFNRNLDTNHESFLVECDVFFISQYHVKCNFIDCNENENKKEKCKSCHELEKYFDLKSCSFSSAKYGIYV